MNRQLEVIEEYKYLGVLMTEHLDFTDVANTLSDSAGRAFGSVMSKMKSFRSLDFEIFTKLFDTCITPIMDYSSGVWGFKDSPHADAVQNRIIRRFLGVHRFTPTLAVTGDMGWTPAIIKRKVNMVRLWCRLVRMNEDRLTKRIFLQDLSLCNSGVKNWCSEIKHIFQETDQMYLFETVTPSFSLSYILETAKERKD